MTAIMFDSEQLVKLTRLLNCDPGLPPSANDIIAALAGSIAKRAQDNVMALSLGGSRMRSDRDVLVDDMEAKAAEATLRGY